ncbi:MAG TPA: enoyl-CoA hydratase-related protein [Gemmataceae bacterium]|jgi:methylglutaconyl-CoA hydratase|nr:enoyl-CoA hydratase-related protein [Gemmataceae bacterium]
MSELVRYEIRSPAAVLTLLRGNKRNALSRELIAELDAAIRRAADDPAARCVILTGEGTAFCAGMDLEELRSTVTADADVIWADAQRLAELFDRIYSLPKPTIAATNGAAVAGGAGLVTVCDLAISVPTAKFGYPEVRRGLVAAMVLPHLLRHVGERAARHLLLTGELIDAEEAARVGLINQVVGATGLMDSALTLARQCAEGGPLALATTKDLLKRFSTHALSVEEGAKASAAPRLGDECRAGLAAFFDKRPVPWAANP